MRDKYKQLANEIIVLFNKVRKKYEEFIGIYSEYASLVSKIAPSIIDRLVELSCSRYFLGPVIVPSPRYDGSMLISMVATLNPPYIVAGDHEMFGVAASMNRYLSLTSVYISRVVDSGSVCYTYAVKILKEDGYSFWIRGIFTASDADLPLELRFIFIPTLPIEDIEKLHILAGELPPLSRLPENFNKYVKKYGKRALDVLKIIERLYDAAVVNIGKNIEIIQTLF